MQYIGCPGFLQASFHQSCTNLQTGTQPCRHGNPGTLLIKPWGTASRPPFSSSVPPLQKHTVVSLLHKSKHLSNEGNRKAIQRKIKPLQKVSSWAQTSALVLCEAGSVTVSIIRFKSIAGGSCLIWKLQGESVIRANMWTATLWHRKIFLQNSPTLPFPSCLGLIPRSHSTSTFPPGPPFSASLGHHTPWLPDGSLWSRDFHAPSLASLPC